MNIRTALMFKGLKFLWLRSVILDRGFWNIGKIGKARYKLYTPKVASKGLVIEQQLGANSATSTFGITATIGAGHTVVICVDAQGPGVVVSSISSSGGETENNVANFNEGTSLVAYMSYFLNCVGGSETFTVTASQASGYSLTELSGGTLKQSETEYNAAPQTSLSFPSPLNWSGGEFIIVLWAPTTSLSTYPSDFTLQAQPPYYVLYFVATSSGSSYVATTFPSGYVLMVGAVFG